MAFSKDTLLIHKGGEEMFTIIYHAVQHLTLRLHDNDLSVFLENQEMNRIELKIPLI